MGLILDGFGKEAAGKRPLLFNLVDSAVPRSGEGAILTSLSSNGLFGFFALIGLRDLLLQLSRSLPFVRPRFACRARDPLLQLSKLLLFVPLRSARRAPRDFRRVYEPRELCAASNPCPLLAFDSSSPGSLRRNGEPIKRSPRHRFLNRRENNSTCYRFQSAVTSSFLATCKVTTSDRELPLHLARDEPPKGTRLFYSHQALGWQPHKQTAPRSGRCMIWERMRLRSSAQIKRSIFVLWLSFRFASQLLIRNMVLPPALLRCKP